MVADLHLAYITIPLLLLVLGLRWLRRGSDVPAAQDQIERDGPVGFGYKASWLALRSTSQDDVAVELGLTGTRSATWSEGVEAAYEAGGAVFVTPPVDGWVLALGRFGSGWDSDEDLAGLSRRFGEAQLFGTHRVSGYDEWQRWIDGEPVRRYAFADEVLFDEGEREGADAHEEDDDWWPDEEVTIAKAREWSVDPTTLDERTDLAPTGLLGFRRS